MSSLTFHRFFRRSVIIRKMHQCPTSSGAEPHAKGGYLLYKRIALFGCLPVIAGLSVMNYLRYKSKSCAEEREPFHKYPYLRIRTRRFPWGDGQKSLFHNPKTNPLPDGYEKVEGCEKDE